MIKKKDWISLVKGLLIGNLLILAFVFGGLVTGVLFKIIIVPTISIEELSAFSWNGFWKLFKNIYPVSVFPVMGALFMGWSFRILIRQYDLSLLLQKAFMYAAAGVAIAGLIYSFVIEGFNVWNTLILIMLFFVGILVLLMRVILPKAEQILEENESLNKRSVRP